MVSASSINFYLQINILKILCENSISFIVNTILKIEYENMLRIRGMLDFSIKIKIRSNEIKPKRRSEISQNKIKPKIG